MLVKLVRKGRVTIEEAAKDAGMTVEEFEKVLKNTPLGRSLWQDSCVCHRCDRDLSGASWEECISFVKSSPDTSIGRFGGSRVGQKDSQAISPDRLLTSVPARFVMIASFPPKNGNWDFWGYFSIEISENQLIVKIQSERNFRKTTFCEIAQAKSP